MTVAISRTTILGTLAILSACGSSASIDHAAAAAASAATPASTAVPSVPPIAFNPPPGIPYFRLASIGVVGKRTDPVPPRARSCGAVIGGWLFVQGSHWMAVDTVLSCTADNRSPAPAGTPPRILVDSGLIGWTQGDSIGFKSLIAPDVLPSGQAAVGIIRAGVMQVRAAVGSSIERYYQRTEVRRDSA